MLKSLLLAAGLAVGASTLGGADGGGGLVARPGTERTRPAAVRRGAASPRLVLLPAVPADAATLGATGGRLRATPVAQVGPAARAEFVGRARRLVAERLAAERCCR